MVSTIPLAFIIGLAVSSLSAQSSFAIGAFVNSTLGSIIEMLIYFLSIWKGLSDLTTAGITGAILGNVCSIVIFFFYLDIQVLLIPAVSMIAGGIKYRQLRFNPIATGASGSLLLISVIGACVPTVRLLTLVSSRPQIFYSVYANYDLNCAECSATLNSTEEWDVSCTECSYQEATKEGSVYNDLARPLSWFCACLLPIAYIIGCLFTLKTHSCIYFCCFFKITLVVMYDKQYFKKHYGAEEDPTA